MCHTKYELQDAPIASVTNMTTVGYGAFVELYSLKKGVISKRKLR
jgi:hypothetical protein